MDLAVVEIAIRDARATVKRTGRNPANVAYLHYAEALMGEVRRLRDALNAAPLSADERARLEGAQAEATDLHFEVVGLSKENRDLRARLAAAEALAVEWETNRRAGILPNLYECTCELRTVLGLANPPEAARDGEGDGGGG